jgi:predicted nucleic acid-binding Zn ribbon protein
MRMKPRFCRVCGQQFRPVRFDALTCSTTCRMRKTRGADLAYLATLPPDQA